MAIRWGYSSGYLSLGIDMWYSGDPNSGSVTVTAVYYVRADGYGHNFNSTVRFSGETSGAKGYSFYSPTGGNTVKEIHRVSWQKNTAYGSPVTATTGFTTDTIWNGGKPSASASIQIPARAYQTPASPTGVSARRDSDSQITVSWSQATSAAAPVTSFAVERMSESDPVWRKVGTVGNGSARSWTDTSVVENQKYTYRVSAGNGKTSPATPSQSVATTPSAPSNVRAAKTASGDIQVSWTPTSEYQTSGFEIFDNGVSVGTVNFGQSVWVHARPSTSQTHTYRVRAVEGALKSAQSAPSQTVQLLAPPNAPRPKADDSVQSSGYARVEWTHVPVDATPQTQAKIRYRRRGSAPWSETSVNGQENSVFLLVSPGVYEWQVQTWGLYGKGQSYGASPWSALTPIVVEDRPTLSVQNAQITVHSSFLTINWTYYQAQGTPQGRATLTLVGESGFLEEKNVDGTANSFTFSTKLEDKKTYTVSILVVSSSGLESEEEQIVEVRVSFLLPPQPRILLDWSNDQGYAQVTVVNPNPGAGQSATAFNQIHRSVDGGKTWESVAGNVDIGGSVVDPECLSNGRTFYKVTAVTAQGAAAESQHTPLDVASQAIWLSGGEGFRLAVPLEYNPIHSSRSGLVNRKVYHFAGRPKGVELSGIQTEYQINISAALFDENAEYLERLKELSYQSAPFIYRDPTGRRIYCSLSHIDMSRSLSGLWTVKTQIEEVDRE